MRVPRFRQMVGRISWFTDVHYEVLLFYKDHDIVINAGSMAQNLDYSSHYMSQQMRKLARAGLLEKEGRYYALSDLGREFVEGELDVEEVEALEPDGDLDDEE